MEGTFNLFRLNCMMDDNKSKNYNAIIKVLPIVRTIILTMLII